MAYDGYLRKLCTGSAVRAVWATDTFHELLEVDKIEFPAYIIPGDPLQVAAVSKLLMEQITAGL